ncbi:TPA: phage tail protein, partial [Escherichia coli]
PLSAFVRGILGKNTAGEIIEALSLRDTVNKANSAVPNTRKVNGMALSSDITISNISGNAGTATRLQTARRINNVPFDGTSDITITATGVQDIRLGSAIGIGRGGDAPSGHLLSGVDGGESVDWANARPVQVLINGVWRNVASL